ncbi:hypothetical protein ACLKMH_01645 [Psychromonas sp. KJ10-10]
MKKLLLPLLVASLFTSVGVSAKTLKLGHAMSLESACSPRYGDHG